MSRAIGETPETKEMSDRDLLLATYFLATETNGRVKDHEHQLYGYDSHGIRGLVHRVDALDAFVEAQRVAARTVSTLIAVFGIGNVVGLVVVATKVF